MTGLDELFLRRQKRCLAFAKSSVKYPVGQALFPENIDNGQNIRAREKFIVNCVHTESYKRSAVPYCLNLLNAHISRLKPGPGRRPGPGGGRGDAYNYITFIECTTVNINLFMGLSL